MSELFEEGFTALLKGTAAVTDLVGEAVYPLRLPQASAGKAIVYRVLGGPREGTHAGDAGLPSLRVQLECYGETYLEAKRVAKAVTQLLSGYRGPCGRSGTIAVDLAVLPDDFDVTARRDRVLLEAQIMQQEGN